MSLENGKRNGIHRKGKPAMKSLEEAGEQILAAQKKRSESTVPSQIQSEEDKSTDGIPADLLPYRRFVEMMRKSKDLQESTIQKNLFDIARSLFLKARPVNFKIAAILDDHNDTFQSLRERYYKEIFKEKGLGSEEIHEGSRYPMQIVPLESGGVRRKPKDLGDMPREFAKELEENPAQVNNGIFAFTRELENLDYEDPVLNEFGKYLGRALQQRAFRENPNDTDRARYIFAYWGLLERGIIKERHTEARLPTIIVDHAMLKKHLQAFILLEKERRLGKALGKLPAEDPDRNRLETELAEIRNDPEYAQYQQHKEKSHSTIVEVLGGRLWTNPSSMPLETDALREKLAQMDEDPLRPMELAAISRIPRNVREKLNEFRADVINAVNGIAKARHVAELMRIDAENPERSGIDRDGFMWLTMDVMRHRLTLQNAFKIASKRLNYQNQEPLWDMYANWQLQTGLALEEAKALQEAMFDTALRNNPRARELHERATSLEKGREAAESEAEDHLQALETLYGKLVAKTDIDQAIRVLGTYLGKEPPRN